VRRQRQRRRLDFEDQAAKKAARQEDSAREPPRHSARPDLGLLHTSLGNAATGRLFEAARREALQEPAEEAPRHVRAAIEAARGQGSALPGPLRDEMEGRVGAPLGDIRVHEGERAAALADLVDANAFTSGSDIFLSREASGSSTADRGETLAHEITHAAAGGQPGAIQRQRRRRGATTITFTEEDVAEEPSGHEVEVDVANVGSGSTPQQFIDFQIGALRDHVALYWARYRDGLQLFTNTMQFASDDEAEADYLGAALKSVGKTLFDEAFNFVVNKAGPVGNVLTGAKALIEAWIEEHDRAESAGGEVEIRRYINDLLRSVGGLQQRMQAEVTASRDDFLNRYRWASADMRIRPNESGATTANQETGQVVGGGAALLNELRGDVAAFERGIPSSSRFQQEFTEGFGGARMRTRPVSHGGRYSGTLYLSMDVVHEQAGIAMRTEISSIDSSWELVTIAANAGRVAQNLEDSLKAQGKKPYETSMPKQVEIDVGGYEGYIWLPGPDLDNFEVRTNYDSMIPVFEEIWGSMLVRDRIRRIEDITGTSD
jgi:hypothetical protein